MIIEFLNKIEKQQVLEFCNNILILEMDSISEEEKQYEIGALISRNLNEYTTLAKDILEKIRSDEMEAKNNGYCPGLLNDVYEDV
jgi:hypothetical protein